MSAFFVPADRRVSQSPFEFVPCLDPGFVVGGQRFTMPTGCSPANYRSYPDVLG